MYASVTSVVVGIWGDKVSYRIGLIIIFKEKNVGSTILSHSLKQWLWSAEN